MIRIRPIVPRTGRTGLRLGIFAGVNCPSNCIPIPRAISRITPGILEYLLVISKIYDKSIMMQRARII
jgi:hypothetical protein